MFERLALKTVLLAGMMLPMLILYAVGSLAPWLAPTLSLTVTQLGLFALVSFGVASVLSPFAGAWTGKIGAANALRCLFAAVFIAFLLLAQAESLLHALLATVFCGLAQAFANPATNVLVREKVAPSQRAAMVGLKQSGVQMAAFLAGLLLPWLASIWSWRAGFFGLLPVAALLLWLVSKVAPAHGGEVTETSLTAPNRLLNGVMLVQCLAGMALSAFVTFVPADASDSGVSPLLAAQLLAWFGIAGVVSRLVLTPWADRLRDEFSMLMILFGVAALAIALIAFGAGGGYWPWLLAAVLMGGSAVATNAIAMSMIIKDRSFGDVPSASGWLSCAFFAGLASGPLLFGGILANASTYQWAWSAVLLLLVSGAFLCQRLRVFRAQRRHRELALRGVGA